MDLLVDLTRLNDAGLEFRSRFPLWIKMFYAADVTLGLLTSTGLVSRKALSKSVLGISLILVIIQMYQKNFVANSLDYVGNSKVILSCIIIAGRHILVWIADFIEIKTVYLSFPIDLATNIDTAASPVTFTTVLHISSGRSIANISANPASGIPA